MMQGLAAALVLLALPAAAAAQLPAPVPMRAGIEATGRASASAPVHTVIVRVDLHRIGADDGSADMVARLKAAGVDDAAAGAGYAGGPGVIVVHGHLTGVTRDKLDAVSHAVNGSGNGLPRQLAFARFYGLAADCPAIEQQARANALADAKRRAEAIAVLNGVRLGTVTAVAERGGCGRAGPFGGAFAVDPETLSMPVNVEETVIFAIR